MGFREQLIGAYELVSLEAHRSDGQVTRPFGERPKGTFLFDPSGQFSVQIYASAVHPDPAAYVAMFGTYAVDEAAQTFTLTVAGALDPALIGTKTVRHVSFRDGLAVFNPAPAEQDGLVTTTYITWRPAPSA